MSRRNKIGSPVGAGKPQSYPLGKGHTKTNKLIDVNNHSTNMLLLPCKISNNILNLVNLAICTNSGGPPEGGGAA